MTTARFMYMVVYVQEWWMQEWHVWVGLGIGAASLVIGLLAFLQARKAKTAAGGAKEAAGNAETAAANVAETVKNVGDEVDSLIERLTRESEAEGKVRSIPPYAADPPSFAIERVAEGKIALKNVGTGIAYNVGVSANSLGLSLIGGDRWKELVPGDLVEVSYLTSFSESVTPRITVEWKESAIGEVQWRDFVLPTGAANGSS